MGIANASLGNLDEAELHLTNAVKLAEETGQPRSRAYALTSLAEVTVRKGKPEQAKEMCFAALEIVTELNDRLAISAAYANLGLAERALKDFEASEEHYAESLKSLQGMDVPRSVGVRKLEYALMLKDKGDRERSVKLLQDARKDFERVRADDLILKVDSEMST
jgi:tetratricopeptide (TPR) repeat protein